LAHLQRGDLLWNLAAAVVRTVFFFDPLAWLAERQLRSAQESAADALAVVKQRHDPVGYGKLLVSVARKLGPCRNIPTMSMGTAGAVMSLKKRLIAMKRFGHASTRVRAGSAVLLGTVVLLGIVPWRLAAAESKADEEPPKMKVCEKAPGFKAAAHESETCDDQMEQNLATIKIWEKKKEKQQVVIADFKVVFLAGRKATMVSSNRLESSCDLELQIGPPPDRMPGRHILDVRFTRNVAGKGRDSTVAVRIMLADGKAASTVMSAADGSEIGIEATVSPMVGPAAAKTP
jgi:hypothetical protein